MYNCVIGLNFFTEFLIQNYTKGDTELLSLRAILAYNAQKKKGKRSVFCNLRDIKWYKHEDRT